MAKKKNSVESSITFTKPARVNKLPKNYYFDNQHVESLMTEYVRGGCIDVKLRDEIMINASELIRQIIRTHKLHTLGNGKEGTAFSDLYQLAWVQIESSLYKFDARPGHTKIFNMWSQIAKTSMLAHIKKESRDKRNSGAYKEHLDTRSKPKNYQFERFISEAENICQYDDTHLEIIKAIKSLSESDPKPHDGMIDKLSKLSGVSKSKVSDFIRKIRLRSLEFSDSPLNNKEIRAENKYRVIYSNYESEDE